MSDGSDRWYVGPSASLNSLTLLPENDERSSTTVPDLPLDHPTEHDTIHDTPYVPPRWLQTEPHAYPALDPRLTSTVHQPQHPYAGGTSPANSHHSVDSTWTASSSSSASGHHDYFVTQTSRYPHGSHTQHYPAYHDQHRLGLEHLHYDEQAQNTGGSYYRIIPDCQPDGLPQPDGPSAQASSSSPTPTTGQPPNIATFLVSHTPPMDPTPSALLDPGPYLRQQLGISADEPISLKSLPEPAPGEKPTTPLPTLIKLAIYGSTNKRLTLQEIYTELENRFQWFRDHKNDKAWKNSIRHNLSLNKVFKHVPRPITEPGKGSYWQLDVSGGEGYKRARKRRPKNKVTVSEEEDGEPSEMDDERPAAQTRSSSTPVEDAIPDPGARSEGHVVGEGRPRSATRRTGAVSPYPSQSPRYQQRPLPVVAGHDTALPAQPVVRFGQSSFGQSSFPTYSQTRPTPVTSTSASFTALSSSSILMAPVTSTVARPQIQHMSSYDRAVQITRPPPRPGIEYVVEPGGLPTARRMKTLTEGGGQPQGHSPRASPDSASSGSSRTWNDTPTRTQTQG